MKTRRDKRPAQVSVWLPDELRARVHAYQERHYMPTFAEAVRHLVVAGLGALEEREALSAARSA